MNFQKLLAECQTKGDAKSWWSLAASSMTLTSGLYDVASVPAKNLFGAEVWSCQKIKLFGGVLSAAATAIGVGVDVEAMSKSEANDQATLYALYFGKLYWAELTLCSSVPPPSPTLHRS